MATKKTAAKEVSAAKVVNEEKVVKPTAKAVEKAVKAVEKTVKAAEKKAPAKKTVLKESVVLQFAGKEIATADVMKQVKAYWTKTLKNKAGDMKSVTLYVKPEESRAYFVINDDVTGSVEL